MSNYIKTMPKGVVQIHIIQIMSLAGYAILIGMLNFYLSNKAGFTKPEANTLTASFFALNFLLHFLGGALGGRYFSFRGLFLTSLILQAISMVLIAMPHDYDAIVVGLAIFITGAGLNTSCLNMMLTQLFKADDTRREMAFSVNYTAMNVGFLCCFALSGMLQSYSAYNTAFYIASFVLVIASILQLKNFKNVKDHDTYFYNVFSKKKIRFIVMPLMIAICLIFSLLLIKNPQYGVDLILSSFFIALIGFIYLAVKQDSVYRSKIFVFLILSSTAIIMAFVTGMQTSALENFVEYNSTKSLLGINLSPAFINTFETIGVIFFGIILAKIIAKKNALNKTIYPTITIIRGLSFYIIAFLVIPIGIIFSDSNGIVNLIFPIIMLLIVGGGEVQINATNYALVGKLIDPKHQGLFTGYFFVSVAVGIVASGYMANYTIGNKLHAHEITALGTNHLYMNLFISLAIVTTIVVGIYCLISKQLNKVFETN
ncbi:MAG: POT family proton-dependent oligopeptide transporter [Francisella sp.]|jgi:POT family proton-dependent oligopeptide transporter